jgi:hypothetical protein
VPGLYAVNGLLCLHFAAPLCEVVVSAAVADFGARRLEDLAARLLTGWPGDRLPGAWPRGRPEPSVRVEPAAEEGRPRVRLRFARRADRFYFTPDHAIAIARQLRAALAGLPAEGREVPC